jgi:hypothetical protein
VFGQHHRHDLPRLGNGCRRQRPSCSDHDKVRTQDYDIPITANFIEEMHEAVKNSRDLVVLFTRDCEQSPYTRMEFTSFEANAAQSAEHRRMVILRGEDAPLLGLFAPHVYQDLVGIEHAKERRSRILAAVEGRSQALEPPPRPFIGVPPRIASFTGRADELDRLDAILMHEKPAAVAQVSVGRAAVQGMGGVGKTSLAVEYAHRFRGLYGRLLVSGRNAHGPLECSCEPRCDFGCSNGRRS